MAIDSPRRYWVLSVVFGVAAVALVAWLAAVTPRQPCRGAQLWWNPPFLAFQLSRSTGEIEAVFGQADDACRTRMVAALDLANKVDVIAVIAAYTGFLACFFFALRRLGYAMLTQIGLVAVVAGFVFGVIEAAIRLRIMQSLPGTVTSLVLLSIGDTGKYLAFAIAGAGAAVGMLARQGILGRLAGVVCGAGAFMVVLGLNYFPTRPALPIGFAIVSLVVLLYAAGAAARGAPPAAGP